MIRWVWGFWPSVENYIVDASILEAGLCPVSQKVNRIEWHPSGCCLVCSLVNFSGTSVSDTNSIELM